MQFSIIEGSQRDQDPLIEEEQQKSDKANTGGRRPVK